MRMRLLSSLLLAAASLFGAAAAQAGTLTSATWTTELQGWESPLVPVGVPISATGSSTATSFAVSLTVPAFSTQVFATGSPVIPVFLGFTIGGAQALSGTMSKASATMGVPGSQTIVSAKHTAGSMFVPGVIVVANFPFDVGVDGSFHYTPVWGIGDTHYLTVDFYGWTPGTKTFAGLTSGSAALPDVVAKGSFNLTANGGGTVSLVSPTKISIDGPLTQRRAVSLTTLKLTYVPEPSTLLLLAAGGLVLLGRPRRS